MTPQHDADRQLLFGILALQNGFIDRRALIAALHAWAADKARPMAAILRHLGVLDAETADLVAALVRRHLSLHGDDAQRSLAALSSLGSVREDLEQITDPEIQASLPTVAAAHDPDATPSYHGPTPAGPRFRVLRFHARGGLGMVSVALDEELHREVALKEIRPEHVAQSTSRQRFLLEAEITGALEHPGIIPVYGLGHYGDGRPYYAMRLIKGDSLKDAIRRFHDADGDPRRDPGERALALRGLLMRFLDVCNAVAYAHSRGVLHRDLKPGNVMLGPFGETLVVDWGLAKVVGRTEAVDGEATLRPPSASGSAETLPGHAIGTPAYMSPEQAEGRLEQLGPRSDVYSLGATLYCLLTGRAPFAEGDVGDLLARVARGDFPPPRRVNADVPRALEAIALKAMARRPEDRYESARALVRDLERWLADEPVHAYREPLSARAGRWVRRHRVLVTSTAAALVMGLAGLSAVLVVQTRARRLAEAQTELALAAIQEYYTGVSEEVLLKQPEMKDLRARLLQAPLRFYRRLKLTLERSRAADPRTLTRLADASFILGRISFLVGSRSEAEAAFREALAIRGRPAAAHPGVPAYQSDLAFIHNNLGILDGDSGRPGPAEAEFEAARAIWERLARARPDVPTYQANLAANYNNLGKLYGDTRRAGPAEAAYQAALAILKRLARAHPDVPLYQSELASSQNNLGIHHSDTGQSGPAEAAYQAAVALRARLVRDHPGVPEYQGDLAASQNNLGVLYSDTDRPGPAEAAYQAALTIRKRLAEAHPGVPEHQFELALSHNTLGNLYRATDRPGSAEAAFEAALTILERLTRAHPGIPAYQGNLANTHHNLGILYSVTGRPGPAEAAYRAALTSQERLTRAQPTIGEYAIGLGGQYCDMGHLVRDQGRPEEAPAWFVRAIATLEAVLAKEPQHDTARQFLLNAFVGRALALTQLRRHSPAIADLNRAIELDGGPRRAEFRILRALTFAYAGEPRHAAAEAEALEPIVPPAPSMLYNLACLRARTSAAFGDADAIPEPERLRLAEAQAARAVRLLERARAAGYFLKGAQRNALKADPDLDPLRDRDDFRELVRDLDFPPRPFEAVSPTPADRRRD